MKVFKSAESVFLIFLSYFNTRVFVLLASLGLILEASLPAVAQRLSLGIKAGVATMEAVSAVGIFGTQIASSCFRSRH